MKEALLSVGEAERIMLRHTRDWGTETLPLAACTGRIYAGAPLRADRPLPPYHRVSMDGIALRHADLGSQPLAVQATQAAGDPPLTLAGGSTCIEVMTGAVLPHGADTVIRYEDLQLGEGTARLLPGVAIVEGKNIHRRGTDCAAGTVLVQPGERLGAGHLSIAASTGHGSLVVKRLPRTLILTTGDELVPIEQKPLPHQIRRSNGVMLQSALTTWGLSCDTLHLPDDYAKLLLQIKKALAEYDLILCSGGVSKGKFDYLPRVLAECGVQRQFHRLAQRPGKPFWFGAPPGAVVFALPGNPVSSLVCAHRYVRPYVRACLGAAPVPQYARLTTAFQFIPSLTYFLQVAVRTDDQGRIVARPFVGKGSGDFANLRHATGVLELPAGETTFAAGAVFRYWGYGTAR